MFSDGEGRPYRPQWVRKRLHEVTDLAGLPRIRFHDLRHTYGTLLRRGGVDLKVIQDLLGHAGIAVTMDLYGHVLPDDRVEAAASIDEAIRHAENLLLSNPLSTRAMDAGGEDVQGRD